mgnify:FL=1
MTVLSVNVNKIALLRNSRGRDYPNVVDFVKQIIAMGVKGITVHPRPDERHVTRQDVHDISRLLQDFPDVEFNIEGYPSPDLLELVLSAGPAQCTLVPDKPGQLTSDHGWDIAANLELLRSVLGDLRTAGIRSSLFLDPSVTAVELVPTVAADRIELYTEDYANQYGTVEQEQSLSNYRAAAARALELDIGINAGHDLNLQNLATFLETPGIQEVSIGHALVVESLQQGLSMVIAQYLSITELSAIGN